MKNKRIYVTENIPVKRGKRKERGACALEHIIIDILVFASLIGIIVVFWQSCTSMVEQLLKLATNTEEVQKISQPQNGKTETDKKQETESPKEEKQETEKGH